MQVIENPHYAYTYRYQTFKRNTYLIEKPKSSRKKEDCRDFIRWTNFSC